MWRFIIALYLISVWPHLTLKHVLWAGFIALITWPLKKLWDWWSEKFWASFKLSFMASFEKTEGGSQFMKAFRESRGKKEAEIVKQHPEQTDLLRCKECNGTGIKGVMHAGFGDMHEGDIVCNHCGGTGWA
jgi:hypothetical protein